MNKNKFKFKNEVMGRGKWASKICYGWPLKICAESVGGGVGGMGVWGFDGWRPQHYQTTCSFWDVMCTAVMPVSTLGCSTEPLSGPRLRAWSTAATTVATATLFSSVFCCSFLHASRIGVARYVKLYSTYNFTEKSTFYKIETCGETFLTCRNENCFV